MAAFLAVVAALYVGPAFLPASWAPRVTGCFLRNLRASRRVATASLADPSACDSDESADRLWLPPLDPSKEDLPATSDRGRLVLPLFPLHNVAEYVPNSTHELDIFEPRYRAMYNDILVSGSRRFVVADVHTNTTAERIARFGVVFYLEDLSDLSEQTADEVKYRCNHRVIGRVRLHRILNPARWEDASTYLRVETTSVEDDDEDETDCSDLEAEVMSELGTVCALQKQLEVTQIAPDVGEFMNASRADDGGLWSLLALWSNYYDYLLTERGQQLSNDMADICGPGPFSFVPDFDNELTLFPGRFPGEDDDYEDDVDEDEDYGMEQIEVEFEDLPVGMQAVASRLNRQYEEYAETLDNDLNKLVQGFLASTSHRQRLEFLNTAFVAERGRLSAMKAVRSVVGTSIGDPPTKRSGPPAKS